MSSKVSGFHFKTAFDPAEQQSIVEVVDRLRNKLPQTARVLNLYFEEVDSFENPKQRGESTKTYVCGKGTRLNNRDTVSLLDHSHYDATHPNKSYVGVVGHELSHLLFHEYYPSVCQRESPKKHRAAQVLYDHFKKIFEDKPPELTPSPYGINGQRVVGFVSDIGFIDLEERIAKHQRRLSQMAQGTNLEVTLRARQELLQLETTRLTFASKQLNTMPIGGQFFLDPSDDPILEDIAYTIGYWLSDGHAVDDEIVSEKLKAVEAFMKSAYHFRAGPTPTSISK